MTTMRKNDLCAYRVYVSPPTYVDSSTVTEGHYAWRIGIVGKSNRDGIVQEIRDLRYGTLVEKGKFVRVLLIPKGMLSPEAILRLRSAYEERYTAENFREHGDFGSDAEVRDFVLPFRDDGQ